MPKGDFKSNFDFDESVPAAAYSAGTVNATGVDMNNYASASFFISAGTIGSSGTVDVKLQWSDVLASGYVDEDGSTGNDTAITQIVAAGNAQLNIIQPQGRYYRIVQVVAVADCETSVIGALGPKLYNNV